MVYISKTLAKEAKKMVTGLVKSEIRSNLKGGFKSLLKSFTGKSPEDAAAEVENNLGYLSAHYVTDKDNNVKYKPSSMFVYEWLTNAPEHTGKLIKDEESDQVYYDKVIWSPGLKNELMTSFLKKTKIQSPSISGHFDAALKLIPVSDYNASLFKEYLNEWVPGEASVIDKFLPNCFPGLETDPQYASRLFRKWMIGTARRAISPGCSLDGCFTLQGPPGTGKTSFFRNLLPEFFKARTGEIYCEIKSPQKVVENIIGKTVACFDEFAIIQDPKVKELFKQLLTMQNIDARWAYHRNPRRYALRQGFSATTNHTADLIHDPSMSRRLWIIQIGDKRLDFDYLENNRASVWHEAVYLAQQGESCFLSEKEQAEVEEFNKKFLKVD